MKIIHLSYAYVSTYDDPETWLKRISFFTGILESMANDAEVVGVFNINYKGVLHQNGVTYHFPNYGRWELLLPVRFNQFIKKLDPDVVVVHGLISPWQIIMLRWQVGSRLKIIAQHHAERPLHDVRQYLQKWADRYIQAYLFCSFDLGQHWIQRGQIRDPKKIKEIMEVSSHFLPMEKEKARSVTNVSGELVFLWVGRLDINKDPLVVAKAFIQFVKLNPSARLYMIYQTFELLSELQALVLSEMSDVIYLMGKIENEELAYWYNSVDFIISSSHYEGSGIAVCEALSCGCIPVLSNIPSFRMMTDHGGIGVLFETGNETSLVTALQNALALDRQTEKRKVMAQFKRELSFEAISRKTMQIIHELE